MSARPGVAQASHKRKHIASDPFWRERANCRTADPRLFDLETSCIPEALALCRGCQVILECRAERRRAPGIWGGRVYNNHGQEIHR